MQGFGSVLTNATEAQAAAERAKAESAEIERRYNHMYANDIVPALNNWGSEKSVLEAQVEFYRKQNEGARTAGFIPKDAPGYQTPPAPPERDANGRYVAGANPVPGSPAPQGASLTDVMRGMSNSLWAEREYERLYGDKLPEDYDFFGTIEEAQRNRMDFRDYFAQKYKFADKRKELTERKQREHDEGIRKDERSKIEKEWAERGGSNPLLRPATQSNFATVKKAMDQGRAKDPLMMGAEQRRAQTKTMIAADVAERQSQGNA
jgi:hypothetical protein